jgi:tetratricopeptide (TPR) repeat protein
MLSRGSLRIFAGARFSLLALSLLAARFSLFAQAPVSRASADSLYFSFRPAEALERCEGLLQRQPSDFEVLWRASRAAVALGILAGDRENQRRMYTRAEDFARRAVQVAPRRVEGHYWLAAALGRRALHENIVTTARLASQVQAEATTVLAIDSLHAGAHDVLGKLNSEVRNLPAVLRLIAGRVLGISVARYTSWELAERHLRRAIELDPTSVLYRADLAQLFLRVGRRAAAEETVRALEALPLVHPPDALFQREALQRLANDAAAR